MKEKLFVLSIDSLFYEDLEEIKKTKYLSQILNKGSYVMGLESIYPSMTYPAHVSMVTGEYPAVHGIYHNEKVEIQKRYPKWHWFKDDIKVKTISDYAKDAGYTIGSALWPVMGNDNSQDYCLAEIWADTFDGDPKKRFEKACSKVVMEKYYTKHASLMRWKTQPHFDNFACAVTKDIITDYDPDIYFLHLSHLDHSRHTHGVYGDEIIKALHECDRRFGEIYEHYMAKGQIDDMHFIVMGDHGHQPVEQVVHLNTIFKKDGFITLDDHKLVSNYEIYCHSAGLSAHIVLSKDLDNQRREYFYQYLMELQKNDKLGIEQIFTKEQVKNQWHLDGHFDFVLEGVYKTAFGNEIEGATIRSFDNSDYKISKASHGHLPNKGPNPIFMACGPKIKTGAIVPLKRLIDAPLTMAKILDLPMSATGKPIVELFK